MTARSPFEPVHRCLLWAPVCPAPHSELWSWQHTDVGPELLAITPSSHLAEKGANKEFK